MVGFYCFSLFVLLISCYLLLLSVLSVFIMPQYEATQDKRCKKILGLGD